MAQCFTGNSSKIKTGSAFTDTVRPPQNKSDIRAKIIQRLLKIDGFENGVAGVGIHHRTEMRGNGFSLSAPERYLANNKRR